MGGVAATGTLERRDPSQWREPGLTRRPRSRLRAWARGVAGRPGWRVAALAVAAGAWAAIASARLFPYLTVDKDEAVYLLQADTLRHGRLFPPAPSGSSAGALLPWLSAHVGDHYVPKYTPVW